MDCSNSGPCDPHAAAATGVSKDVFDESILIKRLMGDESLAREILDGFLADIPNQIASLREAVNKGDAPLAHRQAHTIKGAASNVGALALQQIAFEVERACEAGDLVTADSIISKVEDQFETLKTALASSRAPRTDVG